MPVSNTAHAAAKRTNAGITCLSNSKNVRTASPVTCPVLPGAKRAVETNVESGILKDIQTASTT